jgi:hypothetical protein
MTALALQPGIREYIIDCVARGIKLADIAQGLGLAGKGQAIANALASDPEYMAAREDGLAERMDLRERQLECAEKDDVPRARELLNHARWRCEREAPKRWGAKQQLDVNNSVTVVLAASDSSGRLIEHDAAAVGALATCSPVLCLPDAQNEG